MIIINNRHYYKFVRVNYAMWCALYCLSLPMKPEKVANVWQMDM